MSESPSCFTQKHRKARKSHKCCECYQVIEKGDVYLYSSGVWGGIPSSFKQCSSCDAIITAIQCSDHYDHDCGLEFGELKEYFYQELCTDFNGDVALTEFERRYKVDKDILQKLLNLELNNK